MPAPVENLYELLKQSGLINQADLDEAKNTAVHLSAPLHEVIIGRKLISKQALGEFMGKAMGVGFVDLKQLQIPKEILGLVNEDVALERKVVPFAKEEFILSLAMEDPKDLEAINFVRKISGLTVTPYFAFEKDIKYGLRQYKSSLAEDFKKLVGQVATNRIGRATAEELAADVSIVEAVNKLLEFAVVEEASDIHIEPLADALLIRYRIDGVLHDMVQLPKNLHAAIIARLKILSSLKLDETRLPQDGRIRFESDEGDVISLRVSILPTVEGEKVVMRLLEGGTQQFSLEDLGFDEQSVNTIKKAISKPHGLVLITGPTGSGKTTSLYTMLGLLNKDGVNIATVEDPVENRIRRINQTQINPQIELTFANGLRALLRQDPDIIMVGEIRDAETAQMAVNASMTGHLVLSTLHTNSAPGAIPRLLDLGAEPFLVASTVELVIAQRLVRKICTHCQIAQPFDKKVVSYLQTATQDEQERAAIAKLAPESVKYGKGCDHCGYTGYQGRIGIYEMFTMNDELRELIMMRAATNFVKKAAIKNGMRTMLLDGLEKVRMGTTTLEEVLRVAFD
jgi:type IV pilus assembly protein PilB